MAARAATRAGLRTVEDGYMAAGRRDVIIRDGAAVRDDVAVREWTGRADSWTRRAVGWGRQAVTVMVTCHKPGGLCG